MVLLQVLFSLTFIASARGWTIFWDVKADPVCNEQSTLCSDDCGSVFYCPGEGLAAIKMFDCASGTFCSTNSGQAACDASRCGSTVQPCTVRGALPSPTNCSLYYVCGRIGQVEPPPLIACPLGVFDTITKGCSESIPCREPIVCKEPGQHGFVDPIEKQFEYICDPTGYPIVIPAFQNATLSQYFIVNTHN